MASTFRWTVEFSDLRGRNLGGAASSSPSAPYLKLNLDNLWEGTTVAAKRGAAPTWEVPAGGECVRYETRHAARLAPVAALHRRPPPSAGSRACISTA